MAYYKYSVNLAPLIDVVFILLAFLLIYSRIDPVEIIEVELPVVNGEAREQKEVLTIVLTASNEFFLGKKAISEDGLRALLSKREKNAMGENATKKNAMGENAFTKDTVIEVRADKAAHAESLIFLMQILSEHGVSATQIVVTK